MGEPNKKFIVDEKGRKTAIVLDINEYRNLLEDLEDLRLIAERRNEPAFSASCKLQETHRQQR